MVFKVLQIFPIGLKSLIVQALYAFTLFFLVFAFDGHQTSFLLGFLFSQIYMLLFFYSITMILDQKKRKLGITVLFLKWIFLISMLFYASLFLEGGAFLIGLSGIGSFLFCYILEKRKYGWME